jgi:hypothetical protein
MFALSQVFFRLPPPPLTPRITLGVFPPLPLRTEAMGRARVAVAPPPTPRARWSLLALYVVLMCPSSLPQVGTQHPLRGRGWVWSSSSSSSSSTRTTTASYRPPPLLLASAEHNAAAASASAASPAGPLPPPPPGSNGPDTSIYLDGANLGHAVTRYDFPSKSITLEAWVMRRRDDASERIFSFGVTAGGCTD